MRRATAVAARRRLSGPNRPRDDGSVQLAATGVEEGTIAKRKGLSDRSAVDGKFQLNAAIFQDGRVANEPSVRQLQTSRPDPQGESNTAGQASQSAGQNCSTLRWMRWPAGSITRHLCDHDPPGRPHRK